MEKIEKIQHASICFIRIDTKIDNNLVTIEDRADFYKSSSVAHRYILYTITTKDRDKIMLKIKIKEGRIDISYDKISKNTSKDNTILGVTKFGGTIDIYDENVNKKLIRFLVKTLYKVDKYISNRTTKK